MYNKRKNNNLKLLTTSLFLAMILSFSGSQCSREISVSDDNPINVLDPINAFNDDYSETYIFAPGEHIIAVKPDINRNSTKIIQLECPTGYKIVGMNIDSNVSYILYSNTETVIATSSGVDSNNNPVFTNFGTVLEEKDNSRDDNIYRAGEHVLAVPTSRPSSDELQIDYHEGYEVIDIAEYTIGRYSLFGGGFIIYANTEDVEINGNPNDFGTPIEQSKVKTLS